VLRTSRNDHDVARAADPLFGAEAELHLALEHPNDLLIRMTGSTWTPAPMLHHTIIPWSPERMRRLIFSLICSSSKAANVPKPTSVGIASSQIRIAFGGAWPTKCTTSISATVPVRGVKVISPHRPDDRRATIYDSSLLAHVWTNCTGADRVLARPVWTCPELCWNGGSL
jgi:hypothetical protein